MNNNILIDIETINGLNNFEKFIFKNYTQKVILVLFSAKWCGPCKILKKRLADPESYQMMDKLIVAYVDVDEESNQEIVNKYKVSSIPTQIIIDLEMIQLTGSLRINVFDTIIGYDFERLKKSYDNYLMSNPYIMHPDV